MTTAPSRCGDPTRGVAMPASRTKSSLPPENSPPKRWHYHLMRRRRRGTLTLLPTRTITVARQMASPVTAGLRWGWQSRRKRTPSIPMRAGRLWWYRRVAQQRARRRSGGCGPILLTVLTHVTSISVSCGLMQPLASLVGPHAFRFAILACHAAGVGSLELTHPFVVGHCSPPPSSPPAAWTSSGALPTSPHAEIHSIYGT